MCCVTTLDIGEKLDEASSQYTWDGNAVRQRVTPPKVAVVESLQQMSTEGLTLKP